MCILSVKKEAGLLKINLLEALLEMQLYLYTYSLKDQHMAM